MKRKLIASIIAALLSPHAYADTASIAGSGMGLLENEWVKAGVNANTGTLGSGGGTSPGLLFDKDGTGTFNAGYDYLTPGSPFDGFSLKVDSTNKTNNNTGTEQIAGQGVILSNSNQTLTWTGSATYGSNTWNLTNAYTLAPNTPYIDITTTIVAGGSATNVYFAKFIDPDSQGMPGDSSSTDNVLGYGVIPSTNVAFSEATVSRYALGLYSSATNVTAGVNGWNTDATSYNGTQYPGGALYGNSDDTIGLSFHWTSVSAGDTLTASYAYIFGPSAFSAASSAVTGGAGGGTPGTAPGGGTLVDVGSATDAATSGGSTPPAPTITGTATVNGSSSYADINGDSVVFSTSQVAGDYSTRNYNSLTTTEVGRTTTTPRTIVTSWSDSTTTSAATTSLVVPENYFHAVDITHADVATGSVATADSVWVSNGLGAISYVDSPIVFTNGSKYAGLTTRTVYSANEAYTITTPTEFTYNRTTTAVTTNDFVPTSVYTDTTSTAITTSIVTDNYNVVTNDSIARSATVDFSLSARNDQGSVVTDVHSLINRNTEFGKTINYKFYDHNIAGYSGSSNQFGVGYTKDIAGDMNLGVGINKINTSLRGHNSSIKTDTTQIGATLFKEVKGFDLKATAQHSWINYDLSTTPTLAITGSGDSRLLPSYAIVGTRTVDAGVIKTSPSGTDSSLMVKATGPGTIIRPVLGATLGYRRVGSYTTQWNIVPGMRVEERASSESDTYGWATLGAEVKYNMLNATLLHHTDGVTQMGVGLEKSTNKVTFNLRADRLETKDGGSNLYTANMIYQF